MISNNKLNMMSKSADRCLKVSGNCEDCSYHDKDCWYSETTDTICEIIKELKERRAKDGKQ